MHASLLQYCSSFPTPLQTPLLRTMLTCMVVIHSRSIFRIPLASSFLTPSITRAACLRHDGYCPTTLCSSRPDSNKRTFFAPRKKAQIPLYSSLNCVGRASGLATASVEGVASDRYKSLTPPTSFDDGTRPFQVTTPIYYVNDKPHIGHAYTSIGKY
jgi:hypothetical protein